MNTFHAGWYLIYTKPRQEKKVHIQLTEKKINTFLPTRKILRKWHDRRKIIDEPLFPSYIFLYLNDMKNYYDGIDTDGCLCYVKNGKDIARVSDSVINSIRIVTDRVENLEVSGFHFQAGQRMVINKGPLAGLSCEVIQTNGRHRILVRVDLLKRNILVSVSNEYLTVL